MDEDLRGGAETTDGPGLLARIVLADHRDDFVLKGGVLVAAFAALDVADGLAFDPAGHLMPALRR